MRNEAYLAYAAMTNDEVQRSIRTFYEAVKVHHHEYTHREDSAGRDDFAPDSFLFQCVLDCYFREKFAYLE